MNKAFIDTNIFYNILFETSLTPTARRLLEENEDSILYTSLTVVNELLYIATRRYYQSTGLARGAWSLKKLVAKRGYPQHIVEAIEGLLEGLEVNVLPENLDYSEVLEAAARLRLLPSDAVIALVCRYNGIDTIITFDDDFRRVPWLRTLP